ncbi:MAG: MBL fold metallo-hydrolase [Hyphomonadaceae bacterium]|nr:MBL fold metallo-hydrolase [Hyphomonadaceae bacterium]
MAQAMLFTLLLALLQSPAEPPPPPEATEVARGVYVLPGSFLPGRGPDGNTVIFDAPEGLVVVDTGRHQWHSDAILALAQQHDRPIAAILNTHWHLDHSSGNGRLQAAFPHAQVFATGAVDRALAADGFLTRNRAGAEAARDSAAGVQREEIDIFLATMAAPEALRADVVINSSQRLGLAGRALNLRVAERAVTDADLWLYDRRTRVAVLGDLVTLPAPFFETACPERWRTALDQVWATPFRIAIPGHGAPMSRAQFDAYRQAYGAFVDCVNSAAEASACAAQWSENIAQFTASDPRARRMAPQMAEYYVGYLRAGGGQSPDCLD